MEIKWSGMESGGSALFDVGGLAQSAVSHVTRRKGKGQSLGLARAQHV